MYIDLIVLKQIYFFLWQKLKIKIDNIFLPTRNPLELWKIAFTGHFPQEVRIYNFIFITHELNQSDNILMNDPSPGLIVVSVM